MSIPIPPQVRVIESDNRGRLSLKPWTEPHTQYTVEHHVDGSIVLRPFRHTAGGPTLGQVTVSPEQLAAYAAGGVVTDPGERTHGARVVHAGETVVARKELPS